MRELTFDERALLDMLADAWNGFCTLPGTVDHHVTEFSQAIHEAQRIIMCRPVSESEHYAIARKVDFGIQNSTLPELPLSAFIKEDHDSEERTEVED